MSQLSKRVTAIELAILKNMTDEQLEAITASCGPAVAERMRTLSDSELQAIASGNASPELIKFVTGK